MHTQFRCQSDSPTEEKEDIYCVHGDGDDGVDSEALVDAGRDQVEDREHAPDGEEHDVIYDGRVAGFCIMDDIADEGEDEEGKEEL